MDNAASDESLMLRYRDGNVAAFETLYKRYKGPLYRYFLRQCGEVAVAEELYQEVWVRLIRARQRYRPDARFSTFLYHVAHNCLIDHYRSRAGVVPVSYHEEDCQSPADPPAAEGVSPTERSAVAREQTARLLELIAALPEAQREAFLMKAEGGMDVSAIAEATGVGRETAKSRLRYAYAALRRGMGIGE